MSIHFVVYGSAATETVTPALLEGILSVSRVNNAGADLTGMLLHADNNFIQVLEGPVEAVRRALARIENDPRHSGLHILARGETAARQFPEWKMACRELTGVSSDAASSDLRADILNDLDACGEVVMALFQAFYRSAFRFEVS